MKHTDGLFLAVFREVAKDYPEIEAWETLVDALCMGLVQRPEEFDVLVLPNLYGDIISDLTAGLVGGLGVAPGANIGTEAAVFEATHGSAPKYKGQNKVNPTAMILSGKLMLEHLGERDAARRLEEAVAGVIADGERVTYDLKPTRDDPTAVGTSEYADAIIERLALTTQPPEHEGRDVNGRKKVTVVGAGNVGATCALEVARRDYADVVLVDIMPNFAAGQGARHEPGRPPCSGYEPTITGIERLRRDGRLRRRRDHRGPAALAGDEPGRPRDDERGDRRGRHQGGRRAARPSDRDRRRLEPARRDVPRRQAVSGFPKERVVGHGGHPRHRALLRVHRVGDGLAPSRT